jgi:hypothetical protein
MVLGVWVASNFVAQFFIPAREKARKLMDCAEARPRCILASSANQQIVGA